MCRRRRLFPLLLLLAAAAAAALPPPTPPPHRHPAPARAAPRSAAATWISRARGGEYGLRAPRPIPGARGGRGAAGAARRAGDGPGARRAAGSARRSCAGPGGCGASGAGGAGVEEEELSQPLPAGLPRSKLRARPAPVPGPRGARIGPGRGAEGPRRRARCPRGRESWGQRVCCCRRSSLAGARDPEPGIPRYSRASPTPYFACAPPVRERQTDSYLLPLPERAGGNR